MRLTFLGTSSGTPTRTRNVTSQVLALDTGALIVLDCGEATQHQLMRSGIRSSRIERILVTHLHGDHLYGLPGLLACMAIHERTEPVQLVGPVGLTQFVHTVMRLSACELPFPLEILELAGDQPQDLGSRSSCHITAHLLSHRIACYGYCLEEAPRPGQFDLAKATALNIPAGPLFGRLQRGESVQLADGPLIRADQVCSPPRPGRKVVLLGDTSDASRIAQAARNCDVLVRETTYDATRTAKAELWGHSTSTMTGSFAAEVKARILIITHFSSRYTVTDGQSATANLGIEDLRAETQRECPGTRVFAAQDLWSMAIPLPEEAILEGDPRSG